MKPEKAATHKLTIDFKSELPPVPWLTQFSEIFSDMIIEQDECEDFLKNTNIISFQLLEFPPCSIIVSKNTNKMRIQS